MTQLGKPEYIVMTDLWGWEQQWHRSTEWRPVTYTGRAKTEAELTGILSNKMYLYGTRFTVVVDHLLLVPMYKSHSKALPARVAKHRSKLRAFDFDVVYEAGITTPSDYGSRHPPTTKQ